MSQAIVWHTSDVAGYLGVDRITVHRRGEMLKEALSTGANPGKNKTRTYTPRDVAIMSEASRLLEQKELTSDDVLDSVMASVKAGQFDLIDEYPYVVTDGAVPAEEVNKIVAEYRGGIMQLKQRLEQLEGVEKDHQEALQELASLKKEVMMLREQLDKSQDSSVDLAAAQAKIEMLERMLDDEKNRRGGGLFRRG